jgi:hypothetical protein
MSITMFTALTLIVHNKLIINSQFFDFWVIFSYLFFSYGAYFAYLAVTDSWYEFVSSHFTFTILFGNPTFYFQVCLITGVCVLIDLI